MDPDETARMCRLIWIHAGRNRLKMAEGGQAVGGGDNSSFLPVHNRGHAVFVVNIDPNNDTEDFVFHPRDSAREDTSNLQVIFIQTLGFNWLNRDTEHQNLTIGQWDHRKAGRQPTNAKKCCLRCQIAAVDHSKSDCFVLVISSHGREVMETEILFSDGKSITLTEIFDALSDKECPSMKGIPRIIILQACRGNFKDQDRVDAMQDRGVPVKVTGNKHPKSGEAGGACGTDTLDNPQQPARNSMETDYDYTLQHTALNKMPTNFLLAYSTVSGQLTARNEIDGSWLIDALQKSLETQNTEQKSSLKPINFLHLLTQAAGYVATQRETVVYERDNGKQTVKRDKDGKEIKDENKSGFKNAVCIHHRLIMPLVFYPLRNREVDIPKPTFSSK